MEVLSPVAEGRGRGGGLGGRVVAATGEVGGGGAQGRVPFGCGGVAARGREGGGRHDVKVVVVVTGAKGADSDAGTGWWDF